MRQELTRVRWLLAALLAALASPNSLSAQPPFEDSPADRQTQISALVREAYQHLTDSQVDDALATIGQAVDLQPMESPESNRLSDIAAAAHRHLRGLSAASRYERLRDWTMPTPDRIRILTTIVPVDAPPPLFARALGERPRDDAFKLATVGNFRGLFCSAWILAEAARDAGTVRNLTKQLADMTTRDVPNAAFVLTLVNIAAGNRASELETTERLEERAREIQAEHDQRNSRPNADEFQPPLLLPGDIVLTAAALPHPRLKTPAFTLLRTLSDCSFGNDMLLRAVLKYSLAQALVDSHNANPNLLDRSLTWWIPHRAEFWKDTDSVVPLTWMTHEAHLMCPGGTDHDWLTFRYPLRGDFEFSCETLESPRCRPGGLLVAGITGRVSGIHQAAALENLSTTASRSLDRVFLPETERPMYHRLSLRCSDGMVTLSTNDRPIWTTPVATTTAPWIGLRSNAFRPSIYRNLRMTGTPVIPRAVHLIEGADLSGWLPRFYAQSAPSPPALQMPASTASANAAPHDWYAEEGVLYGPRRAATPNGTSQSRLHYFRPLQPSESLQYDFYYEPDRYMVHPALGQLAFLLHPDGVRLHWMTDIGSDWTGLPENNTVIDPFSRRGPRNLPLKADGWNSVVVTLNESTLSITINDTEVTVMELPAGARRTFGFYHDCTQTAARIRNVILTGDWPEHFETTRHDNLLANTGPEHSDADRRALGSIFADHHIGDSALRVHRQSLQMQPQRRFNKLSDWVLPGIDHDTIRLALDFTQTHPAPPVSSVTSQVLPQATRSRVQTGARLVSPALDLVDVARELDRLGQLRGRVANWHPVSQQDQQAQTALLAVVAIAMTDFDTANTLLDKLFLLVEADPRHDFESRWPETLAIHVAAQHSETRELARELSATLFARHLVQKRRSGADAWERWLTATLGRLRTETPTTAVSGSPAASHLTEWAPASRTTARSRGEGFARAAWQTRNGRVSSVAGHTSDYLYYHVPLRGNFEVECDMSVFNGNDAALLVADTWIIPSSNLNHYRFGNLRSQQGRIAIEPELGRIRHEMHFRGVVRDNVYTAYINGRPLHSRELAEEFDPWIAIRSQSEFHGDVWDLRVSGAPEIPDEILLTADPTLANWTPYFSESAGEDGHWQHAAIDETRAEITGRHEPLVAGAFIERLLQYHRPMLEDGVIEYDFYYEEGAAITHPALDRLSFLLAADRIRIHWITDGVHDRTGLRRDNVTVEPETRRGTETLPLRPAAWNRMKLQLIGDVVHLFLNNEHVYERTLERTNQRSFGLFYYSDVSATRVRSVRWRGDWPKELPQVDSQLLAGKDVSSLDENVRDLTAVFEHDFTEIDKLTEKIAITRGELGVDVQPGTDGLHVIRSAPGTRSEATVFSPGVAVRGDFNITASFSDLQIDNSQAGTFGGVHLRLILGDQEAVLYRRNARWRNSTRAHNVVSSITDKSGEAPLWNNLSDFPCEATGGRLRIARRGDRFYYLFAEGDSTQFRLMAEDTISNIDIEPKGIRLETQRKAAGLTQVVWTDVSVQAEQLLRVPNPNERERHIVYLMKPDGTRLRKLTTPIGNFPTQGSPAWTPDGKRVAFDCWGGRADASGLYIVDADGGEVTKLGNGSMPTFSPDGKRLAFTSEQGMTIMDIDGGNEDIIDRSGWGVQWAPDGTRLAYGYGGNIIVFDLNTRTKERLFQGEHERHYSYIYWNMCWSRDSRHICFKGRTRVGSRYELTVVDAGGSPKGFEILYSSEAQMAGDIAWHPDGQRVVFPMKVPGDRITKLFYADRRNPGQVTIWPSHPNMKITGVDWSRDGKQLAVTGIQSPDWQSQFDEVE